MLAAQSTKTSPASAAEANVGYVFYIFSLPSRIRWYQVVSAIVDHKLPVVLSAVLNR